MHATKTSMKLVIKVISKRAALFSGLLLVMKKSIKLSIFLTFKSAQGAEKSLQFGLLSLPILKRQVLSSLILMD